MDPPVYRLDKVVHLKYMFYFFFPPGARIYMSRIDKISDSKELSLLLKVAVHDYGLVPLNLQHVDDAREIDYCLCALEQALDHLSVADAVAVHEEAALELDFFTTRLSVDRSVCDDEGVHAVAKAVLEVIRAARSPRVDAVAVADPDLGRVVTAVRGVAHVVLTAVRGLVLAARSPRVEGDHDSLAEADLARSPRVEGTDNSLAGLARAALGEVRAARSRPVLLQEERVPLQVSSVEGLDEALRAAPPHTRGVWSAARVLDVRGVSHLSEAGEFEYELQLCSLLGWKVPLMKKVANARKLDANLVLLNYRLKCVFNGSNVQEDGTISRLLLESIAEETKQLVRVSTEDVMLFQAEVATIPDIISDLLAQSGNVAGVRKMANEAMVIIRWIRAQQLRFSCP